jgi:chorismate mutase
MKDKQMMALEGLRKEIDVIDKELVLLLAKRFGLTQKVGQIKLKNCLNVIDKDREWRQFEDIRAWAIKNELSPEFAESFLRLIIDNVVIENKKLRKN